MLQRVDEMTLNDMHVTVVLASGLSSPLITYITVLAEVKEEETIYLRWDSISVSINHGRERPFDSKARSLFFQKRLVFSF